MPNPLFDGVVDSLQEYHGEYSDRPYAPTKLTDYSSHPVEVRSVESTNLKDLIDDKGWLVQPVFKGQPCLTIVRQGNRDPKEFQFIPHVQYLDAKGRDISRYVTFAWAIPEFLNIGFDFRLDSTTMDNIDSWYKTCIPRLDQLTIYPRYFHMPDGQIRHEVMVPWKLKVYYQRGSGSYEKIFDAPDLRVVIVNKEADLESSSRITRVHLENGHQPFINWTVGENRIRTPRFRLATFPFGQDDNYDKVTYYPIDRPEDYTLIGVFLRQIELMTHPRRRLYNRPSNWDDLIPINYSSDGTWLYIDHEDLRNQTEKDTDGLVYQYSIETHYRGPGKRLHLVANSFRLTIRRHEVGG